jgi:hypothetical protein
MNDDPAQAPAAVASDGGSTLKVLLSYGLSVAGLAVMATAFFVVFGRPRYYQMKLAAIQMVRSQPNRAELAWKNAKGTCLEALAAAMKTAAMIKSTEMELIVKGTKPAYDGACTMVGMYWSALLRRAKLGAGLAFGGVVVAIAVGALPVVHIIALLAVGGAGGFLLSFKSDVDRSLVLARAELLPEVEAAFASGRYVLQP